jgi:hypothetical protein
MIAISVRTQSSLHSQISRGSLAAVFNVEGNLAAFTRPLEPAFPLGTFDQR